MMKNNVYIKQIYEEGLGIIFYQKPKEYINEYIKNNLLKKIMITTLEIIYILFIIITIVFLFKFNYPF